jgi:DNA polymerase IV
MCNTIYFHVDVNSAFLSWTAVEILKTKSNYDLRLIPSIIGGDRSNRHGIVLAKSIPAKPYGIQTGEPIVNALKKCPSLVIEKPDHILYREYSQCLMTLLSFYCSDLEQLSIDECFLDFTSYMSSYASPFEAATLIKEKVYETLGFTVNIGISSKKVLAKMASDFKKPNLVHTLFPDEIETKMWPLPISDLYMCGKSAVDTLHKLGIITIGDLAKAKPEILSSHLKSHGLLLWEYANGIDNSTLASSKPPLKGVGNSTTLPADIESYEEACEILLQLSDKVSSRLRNANQLASMVSIEIKYFDFTSVSKQMQFVSPTNTSDTIYNTACLLYKSLWNGSFVRLIGVRTSKLLDAAEPIQLDFFDILDDNLKSNKQKQLDQALDSIRQKFGDDSIIRGSSLKKNSL